MRVVFIYPQSQRGVGVIVNHKRKSKIGEMTNTSLTHHLSTK